MIGTFGLFAACQMSVMAAMSQKISEAETRRDAVM
jgi:hypothetical protein